MLQAEEMKCCRFFDPANSQSLGWMHLARGSSTLCDPGSNFVKISLSERTLEVWWGTYKEFLEAQRSGVTICEGCLKALEEERQEAEERRERRRRARAANLIETRRHPYDDVRIQTGG